MFFLVWGCNSVVEHLLSRLEALGSISSTSKEKKMLLLIFLSILFKWNSHRLRTSLLNWLSKNMCRQGGHCKKTHVIRQV
jgi:hypothetical protein